MSWLQKMSQQKLLILTRGPSGSGKSTMVEQLKEKSNAPVFSSDDFFMREGQYEFDVSQLGKAHEWSQLRTKHAMEQNEPIIIVDNTNTKFWEMKIYAEMAQHFGYQVEFKEPDWHPELKTQEGRWNPDFLNRMQKNPDRESIGKNLSPEIVQRMVNNYEYNPTVESVLMSEKPF